MNITSSIKRAPKWAWYVSGGLALGVLGIEVYKRRAADTPSPTDTTNAATVAGAATGSAAPSPVITPTVTVQPSSDPTDFAGIFDTLTGAITSGMATIGGLAAGDQSIAQTAIGTTGDVARDVIANAGQAPVPATQQPSIVVNVPGPTPAVGHTPAVCPSSFPHRSSRGCYRCEAHGSGKALTYTHIYQSGARVGGNKTC